MFHEPNKDFLYTAYKVEAVHADDIGTKKKMIATAFIIALVGNVPWIVTNRHVIDIDYMHPTPKFKNFRLESFTITGRRPDDSVYSLKLHENAEFYFHEDNKNDVVLIQARIYSPKGDESIHWHFGLKHLAREKEYKSINTFDLICYTGFPDQHDKLGDRPILRSGHIASDPMYDYSWNAHGQGKCVAYEGFSSGGASGSPVFAPPRGMGHNIPDSRHGYLIGVNAGHIPAEVGGHSGISYFYKSTVIIDIINKYGLLRKEG